MTIVLINAVCGLVLVGVLYRFPVLRVWRRVSLQSTLGWLAKFLVICAIVLTLWIGVLMWQLHGRVGQRGLGSSWVGLDVAEVVGMLLVVRLLHLRHAAVSPVAAATATLLAVDAWFDCESAGPRLDYLLSIALALLAELPLALLLAWVSSQTLAWTNRAVPPQPLR
ncbi:hypothetical protein MXD59_18960 [Frankia sp. Ag45/Mut15]|uniref:Uncharacterized protein n=1 Tax=Frankia umida TaxID=573489 RepID=A0ABT0K219_9ACTN|nr:hypothetical protein [Frankia umida]MCK9877830.1 hypothetical protein [Frankia umida]